MEVEMVNYKIKNKFIKLIALIYLIPIMLLIIVFGLLAVLYCLPLSLLIFVDYLLQVIFKRR